MSFRFNDLFIKYHEEVYPARLVFISFLEMSGKGQMFQELRQKAPNLKPMQFKFNRSRPDLTKLDNVFGLLSTEAKLFSMDVDKAETELSADGGSARLMEMLNVT